MNNQDFKNYNFSMLGSNSELSGELKFKGDTIVNCSVKGDLHVQDEGALTLERDSSIEGNIYAHDVEIFGSVHGSINASGKVVVRSSGEISGKITSAQLIISPGAIVNIEGITKNL